MARHPFGSNKLRTTHVKILYGFGHFFTSTKGWSGPSPSIFSPLLPPYRLGSSLNEILNSPCTLPFYAFARAVPSA